MSHGKSIRKENKVKTNKDFANHLSRTFSVNKQKKAELIRIYFFLKYEYFLYISNFFSLRLES